MLSGRRLDLLDPTPVDIEISDIAHGLARVARWNGQTLGDHAFSVAQHSLLVEDIAGRLRPDLEPRWRLAVLLHDAAEYVIGDMISPFKAVVGGDYRTIEAGLKAAVHLRFGLPAELPARVSALTKRADRIAAFFEATELAGFSAAEARRFFGRPEGFGARLGNDPAAAPVLGLEPWPAAKAQARFLARFAELTEAGTGNHP